MDSVIDFQLPADDVARAEDFYKKTFGWVTNPIPDMNYTALYTGPTDKKNMPEESGFINGGMMKRGGTFDHPVVTIRVGDIGETAAKIQENGGRMLGEKMAIMDMGYIQYFRDTEGNTMCLWQDKKKPQG